MKVRQGIYSFLGDYYHKHENIYPSIKKAAELAEETLNDCQCISELGDVIDKNPAVIIMARENRINPQDEAVKVWLTPELDEKITAYVKNGGSFIGIHTAIASYPADSEYTKMLKGSFVSHPEEHYCVQYKSNEKLPFAGAEAFDYGIMDEHYVLDVDTEATNVFMSLSSEFGEGCGGWYHSYGSGKVIVIVPTHNKEGFEHPETIRLYKEAISWAAQQGESI